MRKPLTGLVSAAAIAALTGCTTSQTLHHEGVTSYAGNAIAANTALQMVDPWPYGVQDTSLETPAERPETPDVPDAGYDEAGGGQP